MLALDVGNTFAKWRIDVGCDQLKEGKCLTENILIETHALLEKYKVSEVYVSWVGSSSHKEEFVASIELSGHSCFLLQTQREMNGLSNGYPEYHRLGVDRWLAMLAVWSKYRSSFCLVDAGTALTIDMVDEHGSHLGGYILPGYRTTVSSLNNATALINTNQNEIAASEIYPATNTLDAVRRGALLSMAGGIEYALLHYKLPDDLNAATRPRVCVVSGGDAKLLTPLLSGQWILNEQVVLDGIMVSARAKKQRN